MPRPHILRTESPRSWVFFVLYLLCCANSMCRPLCSRFLLCSGRGEDGLCALLTQVTCPSRSLSLATASPFPGETRLLSVQGGEIVGVPSCRAGETTYVGALRRPRKGFSPKEPVCLGPSILSCSGESLLLLLLLTNLSSLPHHFQNKGLRNQYSWVPEPLLFLLLPRTGHHVLLTPKMFPTPGSHWSQPHALLMTGPGQRDGRALSCNIQG